MPKYRSFHALLAQELLADPSECAQILHRLCPPRHHPQAALATIDAPQCIGRNSRYRSADILVRLELANAAEADKNVRAPIALLHVVG